MIDLLHAEPETPLSDLMDREPVRVTPDADVVDVTLLMADYNLMTVPSSDADDQLLGVITVDDILEATIPDDWRRREPPPHPEPLHAARRVGAGPRGPAGELQTGRADRTNLRPPEPKG